MVKFNMNDFDGPGPSRGRTKRGSSSGNRGRGRSQKSQSRNANPGPTGPRRQSGHRAASQPPSSWSRHEWNVGILGEKPVNLKGSNELLNQIVGTSSNMNFQPETQNTSTDRRNKREKRNNTVRPFGFKLLEEISHSDGVDIIEKINARKEQFRLLLETPLDKKKYDIFALLMNLVTNLSKISFEESKKLLLLDICNSKIIDHLQLYLLHLPYTSKEDKFFNKYYWLNANEFWSNFMTFCECLINVSPSTAVLKCGVLIEVTTKICLDGLKEKQGYDWPIEYEARFTKIRDSLKVCEERQKEQSTKKDEADSGAPPENFRELTILPTPEELLSKRPYLRPNLVEGSYTDKEHYLDVQFRLLREDCFGPLREGIHQLIENPRQKKYDHIRVYPKVKFLEPFFSNQKVGSFVLLDESTMQRFRNINWAHSKRLLFGSLVLFTKDNCKSFLIGTILERDEKYLKQRKLPVNIVNVNAEYNDDLYTMIESKVYFEPYYHVLKALQDPNFPEHLAMSNYIINVQKVPEKPRYLSQDAEFSLKTKNRQKVEFTVLNEATWPSHGMLGLNSTQYEAFKLALTHEFAVIQGPPGTGKTYLGVKIAKTLLRNIDFNIQNTCRMLVICYTNHALDQFLEALLPVTDSLARIGGRSRNEKLEAFNINKLRQHCYSSNYHEKRLNLKREIAALESARALVEELSNSSVLSCQTVSTYVMEYKIIKQFYMRSGIKDPLKHWLFEDANKIEDANFLFEQQVEVHGDAPVEDIDVDYSVNEREVILDDLNDVNIDNDDIMEEFENITTSFSVTEAEKEMKKRLTEFQNYRGPLYKHQEMRNEILRHYSKIKVFTEMMPCKSRVPRVSLTNTQNIAALPLDERWALYYKWAGIVVEHLKKRISAMERKLMSTAEAYEEARMIQDVSVLKETQVVGMTTSGAARSRKMLAAIAPPIVVVEEAAEVLEAHIVTSLTKHCQHLILIGDHQQLRPSAAYMRLARHYNIEVSLFERMIRNEVHSRRLGVQHRMRPEIAALISPHIYPDLQNHPSVEQFPPVKGVTKNLFFFTHEHPEQCDGDSASKTNYNEADLILRLANYLMQQGYNSEDVTILAAYSGQMFYLRKQRPLYAYLTNVKITVLDNYQGEESKIILLSLVRNNNNNSIGFLGTENRICVALSRAREGFYIFGNIELLKTNSTLWANIATTLTNNESLGTSLDLKCSNHSDQITTIKELSDFVKVPEGGCQLNCKYRLPCEHPCPRICHTYDIVHANIKCTQQCERKICEIENHKCPRKCAEKCLPCNVRVEKSLPCGHNKDLPCHVEAGDPSVYCSLPVSVILPDCGHEVKKPCSKKISTMNCNINCMSRLSCGHACRWKCHVNDDPDHERYTCMRPCPKAKKGCTANLEGDLGEHKCLLRCHEPCQECTVQVVKKRSGCTHSKRVQCFVDVDAEKCLQKCARSLPCGHHCKKLCYQTCGDCKQMVKKVVPGCNHSIQIECGTEPTREHCKRKCQRTMECGHVCPGLCDKPCDLTKCNEHVETEVDSPCGHKVRLPCNVFRSMKNGVVAAETALAHCSAPCGAALRCGHACGGTCSQCHQGRLHASCSAKCHQLNICGHRCQEPCNQVCPPCPRPCEVKCVHSRCDKLCGAPCTPCTESECVRACEHSRCTRPCGAVCDRAPCDLPCAITQPCGHPCRGLCGEPCPKACRICDPDNFPTDLLGDPYEDGDRLVQLQDCPHIMDVDTLNTYMNTAQEESVTLKACPFCRKPIINTYRYKDLINRLLLNDVNSVKRKVYGTKNQILQKKQQIHKKSADLITTYRTTAFANKDWAQASSNIIKFLKSSQRTVSLLLLEMNDVYINILDTLGKLIVKYKEAELRVSKLETEFNSQVKLICGVLANNVQKISQQQQVDIDNELRRVNSIIQLAKILDNASYNVSKTAPNVAEATAAARNSILSWRKYDEAEAVDRLTKLQDAVKLTGIVSKEERDVIVKAIGLKAGHWYKCPNDHFYCIDRCGGAMVLSRCPDCGAAIGGQNHTLTAGNQHAPEMDGSRFAAWSEEANNMANFDLNNF